MRGHAKGFFTSKQSLFKPPNQTSDHILQTQQTNDLQLAPELGWPDLILPIWPRLFLVWVEAPEKCRPTWCFALISFAAEGSRRRKSWFDITTLNYLRCGHNMARTIFAAFHFPSPGNCSQRSASRAVMPTTALRSFSVRSGAKRQRYGESRQTATPSSP